MNLLLGILLGILGQAMIFFQIQGSVKYQFLQDHKFWVLLMGIPISWVFMTSAKYLIAWGDGMLWPSRIIGFGIGVLVFSLLSHFLFGEVISMKTAVCIFLSIVIIMVQIFWK